MNFNISTIKKNILYLFVLKAFNLLISFVTIPLTISYLGNADFGIWLTISSFISWAGFFDFGLSNGLRNSLGSSLAKRDYLEAKQYVSTTFVLLILIIVPIYLVFLTFYNKINWVDLLNVSINRKSEMSFLILIMFSFFCIRFLSGLIMNVLMVDHKPAITELINTSINVLNLSLIYYLQYFNKQSLLLLGIYSSTVMTLLPVCAFLFFFSTKYKNFSPSYYFFDKTKFKNLLNQGSGFFIIQLSALVLFSTDNMIISHIFQPSDVVPYNIAYKLFNRPILVFGIMLTPFWAVFNEAQNKNNFDWINTTIKKLLKIFILITLFVLILLVFSNSIYKIWLSNKVLIEFKLSVLMALYSIIQMFNQIFVTYIFSTGKIRIQVLLGLIAAVINIPLSIYFCKSLHFGPEGVILATTVCISINLFFAPVQSYKILKRTSFGIWNK
jgi:O-antigen/teichoic acid export membrane protein